MKEKKATNPDPSPNPTHQNASEKKTRGNIPDKDETRARLWKYNENLFFAVYDIV